MACFYELSKSGPAADDGGRLALDGIELFAAAAPQARGAGEKSAEVFLCCCQLVGVILRGSQPVGAAVELSEPRMGLARPLPATKVKDDRHCSEKSIPPRMKHGSNTDEKGLALTYIRVSSVFNPWLENLRRLQIFEALVARISQMFWTPTGIDSRCKPQSTESADSSEKSVLSVVKLSWLVFTVR